MASSIATLEKRLQQLTDQNEHLDHEIKRLQAVVQSRDNEVQRLHGIIDGERTKLERLRCSNAQYRDIIGSAAEGVSRDLNQSYG